MSTSVAQERVDTAPRRITFVGAGPGDAHLLTVAALDALRAADLVLISDAGLRDLLADPTLGLPTHLAVRTISGEPEESAEQCARASSEYPQVVRLFRGDPFLDGPGADEAAACRSLGIEVHVVPGLSPRTAVPEYAGVDLSHTNVELVTGSDESAAWVLGGTQVVETVVGRASEVMRAASAAGIEGATAVIATVFGTTTRQETLRTSVDGLVKAVRDLDADAPLTMVVGPTAEQETTSWFEDKPLFGWRVLVPRTKAQSSSLEARLRMHGAYPEEVPTIAVEPPRQPQLLDKAIRGLVEGRYEWVAFTSINAVRAVRDKVEEYGLDARVFSGIRIAAVGNTTGDALRQWGINPDLIPRAEHSAAGLAKEFPAHDEVLDPINRVFLPRADIAVDTLAKGLTELGWEVEDVTAYRTVRAAPPPAETREAIKTGLFDAVVFTSSSTVRNLVGIAGKPHACTIIAAIGPATAATCVEHGLRVDVQPSEPNAALLADSLAEFAARRRDDLVAAGSEVKRPSQRRRRRRRVRS